MKLVFVTLAFLLWEVGQAERLYVLFEDACGNRIRYERMAGEETRMDYFSYSFSLGGGVDLLFETDGEGVGLQHTLPDNYLTCNDLRVTADLAERINGGEAQLFILLQDGEGRYQVQPVVMAALFERQGNTLSYRSPFADFAFNLDNTIIGEDLGRSSDGAQVYFEGSEGVDCSTGYLFQQQNPRSAYPVIDYKVVPGLGITERRLTGNGTYTTGATITAKEVNGESLLDYLQARCATEAAAESSYTETQDNFVPYYVEAEAPSIYTQQSPVLIAEAASGKAAPAPGRAPAATPVVIHRVAAGETLYGIARRYGLSVNTIRAENRLDGNNIFPGQELRIGSEEYAPETFIGEEAEYSYDALPGAPAAPPPPQENPYPLIVTPPAAVTEPPTPTLSAGHWHTVQRGETIASLALRYGYTSARFREFNELGDQAVALVGQRLRTSDCACPPEMPTAPAEVEVPPPTRYETPTPAPPVVEVPLPAFPDYPTPLPVGRNTPVNTIVPPALATPAAPPADPPAYGGGGVPANTGSSPVPAYPSAAPAPATRRATHEVKEGESLYGISRQYGISVEQLRTLNSLSSADVIVPFQKLYLN